MNVDRFAELARPAPVAQGAGGRYEMRPLLATQTDPRSREGFLNEVQHITSSIQQINSNATRIRDYHTAMLQASDTREEARHRQAMEELTQQTEQILTHVKHKIKEIEPTSRHPDLEIRKNQFSRVTTSFIEAIREYRQLAITLQKEESTQLERQIRIANPSATQEQIAQAIAQAEQGRPAVFAQQLMQSMSQEQRRYDAKQTLDAVQMRHEDIRRLAKSVEELHSLFEEMKLMLENQSQVLDQIEDNVETAVGDLEKGTGDLDHAIDSARATRRKKWICFAIFLIIIIIVVVVVVVKVVPGRTGGGGDGGSA